MPAMLPGEETFGGSRPASTLVQVAEEEIYQSKAVFFVLESPSPTYTVLTTLDSFDGDRWTSSEGATPFNSELPLIPKPLSGPQRIDAGHRRRAALQPGPGNS